MNWRPRKTNLDPDYIDVNSESVVFYSDFKELVELFEVRDFTDLETVLGIFIDQLSIDNLYSVDSNLHYTQ